MGLFAHQPQQRRMQPSPRTPPPTPPARRWWQACALLALAGAATLAGWWLLRGPATPAVERRPPSPAAASAAAPGPVAAADRTPTRSSAQAPAAVRPPRARGTLAPGEVEVCGWGVVRLPADDPNPLQRVPPAARLTALDQLEARLAAHASPAVRAAGLLIGARARPSGGRARIEQLARLAAGGHDAQAYALALRGCQALADPAAGSCGLLSRSQAARLAPDNLQVWLALAAEAAAQDDGAAEDLAMQRAARAPRSDAGAGRLAALVQHGLGPQTPALQRTLALSLARGLQDGWTLTQTNHAERWCSEDALADGGRRSVCQAVAETLVARSSSAAEVAAGLLLGRRLGWADERLRALDQEQRAFAQAGESAASGLDFSCDRLQHWQDWVHAVDAGGELQALRARLPAAAAPHASAARQGSTPPAPGRP